VEVRYGVDGSASDRPQCGGVDEESPPTQQGLSLQRRGADWRSSSATEQAAGKPKLRGRGGNGSSKYFGYSQVKFSLSNV
jgi:hypothetical protein